MDMHYKNFQKPTQTYFDMWYTSIVKIGDGSNGFRNE